MKPEIKLFFDFEFTSLSPDAQPISLGIVSEFIDAENMEFEKSFYAEFSDFNLNLCDDWVKENVVKKLQFYPESHDGTTEYTENWDMCMPLSFTKNKLAKWLAKFSEYNIQFVCDCGTFDWYWMLQLLAEWEKKEDEDGWSGSCPTCGSKKSEYFSIGLPKLPDNISPVPEDLNDLIATKKSISVREAFDLNREYLNGANPEDKANEKHNSLWDAKVIKAIYEKLK